MSRSTSSPIEEEHEPVSQSSSIPAAPPGADCRTSQLPSLAPSDRGSSCSPLPSASRAWHDEGYPSIPRVHLDNPIQRGTQNTERVFAGALFPSFDHEANYLAKQAELRNLGFAVDDVVDSSVASKIERNAESDATIKQESSSAQAEKDLEVLQRQLRRRDEMYALSQRRATEEAKQYSEMISRLRAEGRRRDLLFKDSHGSLAAEVEALQYVVQRRNDADDQNACIRFVDVEEEVHAAPQTLLNDLEQRIRTVERFGEHSLNYLSQLSRDAVDFSEETQHSSRLEKELEEITELLVSQTAIKVAMTSDRVRSDLYRLLCTRVREEFFVVPGKAISVSMRGILSRYVAPTVSSIREELMCGVLERLAITAESSMKSAVFEIPRIVEQSAASIQTSLGNMLSQRLVQLAEEQDSEVRILDAHMETNRAQNAARRSAEEIALRDLVLETGKLLETQRHATNDLRNQLLLQAKTHMMSPKNSKRGPSPSSSRTNKVTSSRSPGVTKRTESSSTTRAISANAARRLLFEPLSQDQIKSLYGSLPTHATVVEEVSVEQLTQLAARAAKTKKETGVEQDQVILVSRAPASLMGRGSSSKTPTKLTAVGAAKLGASTSSLDKEGAATSAGKKSSSSANEKKPKSYTNDELIALQELRRLRAKIVR